MTNQELLRLGRTLEIDDKAEWLVKDRIVLVCRPSDDDENYPNKYALLLHENIRVGIVYFMGSGDIHWLVFPEHRGNGYMGHFVRSGVINIVEPELRATTIDEFYCEDLEASTHLAELAGLKVFQSRSEHYEFYKQLLSEEKLRLRVPCYCGSGKEYRDCCYGRDEWKKDDEMHPCWNCTAVKSHSTATRCWKCGGDYEDY
jgi:hypothetical protein